MTDPRGAAERRTDAAFAEGPYLDPRAAYRAHLRVLRERDGAAFERGVKAYEALVQEIGAGGDAGQAWLRYGAALAGETPGRTVAIDADGRASAWAGQDDGQPSGDDPRERDAPGAVPLILHIPDDARAPALPLAAPRTPSRAQNASLALLVEGRESLQPANAT